MDAAPDPELDLLRKNKALYARDVEVFDAMSKALSAELRLSVLDAIKRDRQDVLSDAWADEARRAVAMLAPDGGLPTEAKERLDAAIREMRADAEAHMHKLSAGKPSPEVDFACTQISYHMLSNWVAQLRDRLADAPNEAIRHDGAFFVDPADCDDLLHGADGYGIEADVLAASFLSFATSYFAGRTPIQITEGVFLSGTSEGLLAATPDLASVAADRATRPKKRRAAQDERSGVADRIRAIIGLDNWDQWLLPTSFNHYQSISPKDFVITAAAVELGNKRETYTLTTKLSKLTKRQNLALDPRFQPSSKLVHDMRHAVDCIVQISSTDEEMASYVAQHAADFKRIAEPAALVLFNAVLQGGEAGAAAPGDSESFADFNPGATQRNHDP